MTVNLLPNPGFPGGVPGGWGCDGAATITYVGTDNAPVSGGGVGRWQSAVDNAGVFTAGVNLALGLPHIYSVWIKNNGGATGITLQIRESSGFSSVDFKNITITNQWARYFLAFTSHASIAGHIFYVNGTSGTGFDAYVDAYQIERGSVLGNYTADDAIDFAVQEMKKSGFPKPVLVAA